MPDDLELTVVNGSALDPAPVAVFAALPVAAPGEAWCVTWLAQAVHPGNAYTFTWSEDWGFAWQAAGDRQGCRWTAGGFLPADPDAAAGCAATLAYDGDFRLAPAPGRPDGATLWLREGPTVPPPGEVASSVAVTLAGLPVMAAAAGPNLAQAFTLAPSYRVALGGYAPGQPVDPATVATFTPLPFAPASPAITATLAPDNTWSVTPGA